MKQNRKAILLGLLLALVLFVGLLSVQNYVLGNYEFVEVVVAKQDLAQGTELTKSNVEGYFERKRLLKSLLTESTITKMKELDGYYTGVALKKGTIVYQEELRKDSQETKELNKPVEVSAALSAFSDGVAGTLRKGDYVYLYFVNRESREAELFGSEPIYIKQSFTSAGEPIAVSDTKTAASVFTFLIDGDFDQDFCEAVKAKDLVLVRAIKGNPKREK